MFEDIPRNVWQYISEYNISLILRVPRILFPVPVFQVLYTVMQRRLIFTIVVLYFRLRLWVGYFIYFIFTPVFF